MFCKSIHPDYIEQCLIEREVEHETVNDDGTVAIVTELVTDTVMEMVERPCSHPLGGPVQCRRLPGHSGDHAAHIFKISELEYWPNTTEEDTE
jgi:hypothetical protein